MQNENLKLKKVIALTLLIIVALGLLIWLYRYLTTAKITIKTNDPAASVEIAQVTNEVNAPKKPYSQTAARSLSVTVKSGKYEVLAFNKSSSVAQFINLKARQKVTLTLNPPKPSTPELVYGNGASGLHADSSQLLFIDAVNNYLTRIDSQNNFSVVNRTYRLLNIKWINTALGVAEDQNNNLYAVNNGAVSPISLPFAAFSDNIVGYDVSKNGEIYVSNNQDVYVGSLKNDFKKIYTGKGSGGLSLAAGYNKVAVIGSSAGGTDSTITLVNDSGTATKKDIDADSAAWSPSGKYLLATSDNGDFILNQSLDNVNELSIKGASNFTWKDDNNFYYAVGNQLWSYDLTANRVQNIASMPSASAGDGTITGIFPSSDSSYTYVTSQKIDINNQSSYQLFRVGLKNQPAAPSYTQSVNIFLPETVGICSLNYVNFTKPTIIVQYPAGSSAAACVDTANSEFSYYEVDINKFQLKTVAGT